MNQAQGTEVLRQIGVNTRMAVGARFATMTADGKLQFRITISRNVKHWVEVELNPMDYYNVTLLTQKCSGAIVPIQVAKDVDCESIGEVVYRMGSPKGKGQEWFDEFGIKSV